MNSGGITIIGIDIGGTFTSLCAWDGQRVRRVKVPTTPADPVRGVHTALDRLSPEDQAQKLQVIQGSTVAVNALRERRSVRTVLSGSAGVVAGLAVGRDIGCEQLITCDIGGTSTDVCLIAGQPAWTSDASVDGWPVRVPMLDIHTIGAGGGSIAALDSAGALMVGPRSAGADPGPACYGRSDELTVTDAHVVLGRIRPEFFLGGQMALYPERSQTAVDRLAEAMHVDPLEVAAGVIRVANANMERAIKAVSAERGHDPRACMLVSFGGAGGLHACELAAALGMAGVVIPRDPGVLSAAGMLHADVVRDYARSLPHTGAIDLALLRRSFAEMMDEAAHEVFADGYDLDDSVVDRVADMRYRGQSHELTIPVESLTDEARLVKPFHDAHARQFGYAHEDEPVEIVTLRARSIVVTQKPVTPPLPAGDGDPQRALLMSARIWADAASGLVDAPFYDRARLLAGDTIPGPAVIIEPFATTLLPPCWRGEVHPTGQIMAQQRSA